MDGFDEIAFQEDAFDVLISDPKPENVVRKQTQSMVRVEFKAAMVKPFNQENYGN